MWSGGPIQCKLVNGRPRHPQSQGAVERANQDICNMLATWMREFKTYVISGSGRKYERERYSERNGVLDFE